MSLPLELTGRNIEENPLYFLDVNLVVELRFAYLENVTKNTIE